VILFLQSHCNDLSATYSAIFMLASVQKSL